MENLEEALIFEYPSSSSNSTSPPSAAVLNSSLDHSSLNMSYKNNNHIYMSNYQLSLDDDIHGKDHLIMSSSSNLVSSSTTNDLINTDQVISVDVVTKEGSEKTKKKIRKQPKYAFQTRSPVDILDDGYRWRKYGQKSVKNNIFPRSYYRCTEEGCNVKKQVQRLSKDEGVVVTTYEGMHTHPIANSTHNNFQHLFNQMQL